VDARPLFAPSMPAEEGAAQPDRRGVQPARIESDPHAGLQTEDVSARGALRPQPEIPGVCGAGPPADRGRPRQPQRRRAEETIRIRGGDEARAELEDQPRTGRLGKRLRERLRRRKRQPAMEQQPEQDRPDAELVADLLRERHELDPRFRVSAAVGWRKDVGPEISLSIDRPAQGRLAADRYEIDMVHLGGRATEEVDRWSALVDALDAVVGSLVELRWAHRELPAGPDVEYAGEHFDLSVAYVRPDVEAKADALLGPSADDEG
jgi:hypothetical protein